MGKLFRLGAAFGLLLAVVACAAPQAAAAPANITAFPTIAAIQNLGSSAPFYPTVNVTAAGVGGIFNYASACPHTADGGVYISVTVPGFATACWVRQLQNPGIYNLSWWNVDATGSADASSAINAANTSINANGCGVLNIGAGTFKIAAIVKWLPCVGIVGSGQVVTVLNCTINDTDGCLNSDTAVTSMTPANQSISHLSLYGTWRTNKSQSACTTPLIYVRGGANISADDLEVAYSRCFAIAITSNGVVVNKIYAHDNVRDSVNLSGSVNVKWSNITCIGGTDDCLAFHTSPGFSNPVNSYNIVGSGLLCINTPCLDTLGLKGGAFANITCLHAAIYCWNLRFNGGAEGQTTQLGPQVTNLQAFDTLQPAVIGLPPSNGSYVFLGADSQAGTLGTVPWRSNGTAPVAPYGYMWNDGNTAANTIAPSIGLNFGNFTLTRTLQNTANWSDYNFNYGTYCGAQIFTAAGCVNPAVTDATFAPFGIFFYEGLANANIHDFHINLGATGQCMIVFQLSDYSIDDVTLQDGECKNTPSSGIVLDNGSPTKMNILLRNITLDMDPLFYATGHNADGTWNNGTANTFGLNVTNAAGVTTCNLTFKNSLWSVRGNGSSIVNQACPDTYFGRPVAYGYNAGNEGVAAPLAGNKFVWQNSAGNDTAFGTILQSWPAANNSTPTGYHVPGQLQLNQAPTCVGASSTYAYSGLNFGSGTTAGTDYTTLKMACTP